MNKRKLFGEEDKVLRYAVMAAAVLFVVGITVLAMRITNLRVDSSMGEKKLKELEENDIQVIEAQIQELEKQERIEDEEWQSRPNSVKFANSLVLGDSITQGLYAYETLDAAFVVAEKGVGVHEPDETGLTEMLNQIIAAEPQKLFIALGMNDIIALGGDASAFAKDYEAVLDTLQEALPDTDIYVNSVLPATEQAIANDGRFASVPEYNAVLQELCEERGIVFIDNTALVNEDSYDVDGVHMKSEYYQKWVNNMAGVAEL